MIEQKTLGSRAFTLVNTLLLVLLSLFFLYPMWYVLVGSISDPFSLFVSNDLLLLPKGFSLKGYEQVFKNPNILIGYKNTLWYLSVGTVCNVLATSLGAYVLSRPNLMLKKFFSLSVVFTMYFGGGLIPTYIVASTLHLVNTRWILIMFGSVSVYNMILIRTFCGSTIPEELREAASMDGCSNTRFFFTFVLPLSKAIIAVIALYVAVAHWNNYYNALVYTTNTKLHPLQLYLRQLLLVTMSTDSVDDPDALKEIQDMILTIRYAVIVISTLPIMCLYPFLQKYFVQGVMIGSLKG